jgi:hypothetical protein
MVFHGFSMVFHCFSMTFPTHFATFRHVAGAALSPRVTGERSAGSAAAGRIVLPSLDTCRVTKKCRKAAIYNNMYIIKYIYIYL